MDIILASTSAIRKTLLANAGIKFSTEDSGLDETRARDKLPDRNPQATAIALAEEKSILVSRKFPHCLVIGADQTLGFSGQIYDKPRSLAEAGQQLRQLRNSTHELNSAVCCTLAGRIVWSHCGKAQLTMRNFSDSFLEEYLRFISQSYSSSVGGYKLEERGVTLFERIEGDYFTILGLPLLPLLNFLRQEKYIQS